MSRETALTLNTQTLIGDGKIAWHQDLAMQERLGLEPNHYDGAIPVEDVRRRLFDWEVLEGDVSSNVLTPNGVTTVTDPSKKMLVRSDTMEPLSIVGEDYRVHDYSEWLLDGLANLLDSELHISNAGLIRGGRVAWVQVTWSRDIRNVAGLDYQPFLMMFTSLDQSLSSTAKGGATAAVCDNTFEIGKNEKGDKWSKKHTRLSEFNVPEAREALGIMFQNDDAFEAELSALYADKVDGPRFTRWAEAFAGVTDEKRAKGGASLTIAEKKLAQVKNLWNNDERVAPWAGTALGVLQTANTWSQHIQGGLAKGDGFEVAAARYERNMDRFIIGETRRIDQAALKLLATV